MNRKLLAAAASLALAAPAGVAFAQDTTVATDAAGNVYVMTDAQKGMYATWPADRQTMYEAWPNTYKTYYWTLAPEQQTGWWVLNDDQRARVYAMTPEQRTAAWASIATQMDASATAATDTSMSGDTSMDADTSMSADTSMATSAMPASTTSTGNMQFVRREMTQPVAANTDTAALASGELPVCKPNQQDGCINGWEKNKTGNKPLNYWPGKPASEIPGPKPEAQ